MILLNRGTFNPTEREATGNDRGTVHRKLSGCRKMKIFTLFLKNIGSLQMIAHRVRSRLGLWMGDNRGKAT